MKRIVLSLFVITSIIGVGIFATGAYFTASVSGTNYTFTSGSAGLQFALCGNGDQLNINCEASHTPFTTTIDFVTNPQTIGPGIENDGCLVIKNTGIYTLTLASSMSIVSDPGGLKDAFQVYAGITNASCDPGVITATPFDWESARTAANTAPVNIGSLAPGASMYVITANRWDSAASTRTLSRARRSRSTPSSKARRSNPVHSEIGPPHGARSPSHLPHRDE